MNHATHPAVGIALARLVQKSGGPHANRPVSSIRPASPIARDTKYRRIHQFDDRCNCGALRMMENFFDNAHFSLVHRATVGQEDRPKPEKYELVETDYGFRAET